jgi:hypothetical protein
MRHVHPGFHAFLELHVEDVEAFLAESFEPFASEDSIQDFHQSPTRRRSDRGVGDVRTINLVRVTPVGSA